MSRFTNALMGSLFGAGALLGSTAASFGADTIKVAFIDPLSGPFAATGTSGLAHYRYAAEELVNKTGGVLGGTKFEDRPLRQQNFRQGIFDPAESGNRSGHSFHCPG